MQSLRLQTAGRDAVVPREKSKGGLNNTLIAQNLLARLWVWGQTRFPSKRGKFKYNGMPFFFKAHYIQPKEEDNNHFRVSWQKMSIHSHTQTGFYFPKRLCHQHYHQMATPLIFSRFSTWRDVGTLRRLKEIVRTKTRMTDMLLWNTKGDHLRNVQTGVASKTKQIKASLNGGASLLDVWWLCASTIPTFMSLIFLLIYVCVHSQHTTQDHWGENYLWRYF